MFFSDTSKNIVIEKDIVTRFLSGYFLSFSHSDFSLSLKRFLDRVPIDFSVSSRVGEGWSRGLPTQYLWFHDIGLYRGHEKRVATLRFVRKVEIYCSATAATAEAEVAAAAAWR
ncbi:hypothetical protein TIFTF001_034846 [Ficus carica]|uniref:Uncharacterized protein n=1 Tax=Ficus carica TaxID=3494 RepID=A0AA88JB24_FICCA|nr:hypothetical protein TIFTF001_034821 [Ficus carica]GMN65781.1 hypothetical protein TIFTF001_034846 [Ficus carica]